MAGPSGQNFGKYVLLDRIAAGGMAEIFRAKYVAAAGVTKSVVIKRILPHYAGNPAFVSMFTNEAKIAMNLAHGNIAQVFDFGEIDGEYFLAMELVNGQSLSRLSRGARDLGFWVPMPIAAYILSEICAGLFYAHLLKDEQGKPMGIVHRDVSPQNVIVSYEGQVKLVDFGIAKIRSAGRAETEHGAMKGKYVYFSPEQTRSKPLDGRSDIFAAGIVLYEVVTGRRPFEGKMIEVLSKITRAQFVPPSALNSEVPKALEAIILKALALRPEDRYQTAVEMQDALRHFMHDSDPTFSAESVAHLARFVCRDELERDGLKIDLPQAFIDKMERWRAPPRVATGSSPVGSSAGTSSGKGKERPAPEDRVDTEAGLPDQPLVPRWALAAGVLALGVVVGLGVSFGLLRKVYTLEVSSTPPGAAIVLDGRATGLATPAKIDSVAADKPHELGLTLAGRRDYQQTLPPSQKKRVVIAAAIEPLGVDDPHAPEYGGDLRDPVDAPNAPVPVAAWPETKQLSVQVKAHALVVPATGAARMRLDPARSYRISVEGAGEASSTTGRRPVRELAWFVERATGASGDAEFGLLTADVSATFTGARALYAFALRRPDETGSGSLKVRVADTKSRRAAVLPVEVDGNGFAPGDRQPRLIGLDPSTVYSLSLAGRADLGASGPTARALLCFDGPDVAGVLQAGAARTLHGAKGLWLLVPDDDPADNRGELVVTVAPVTGR